MFIDQKSSHHCSNKGVFEDIINLDEDIINLDDSLVVSLNERFSESRNDTCDEAISGKISFSPPSL